MPNTKWSRPVTRPMTTLIVLPAMLLALAGTGRAAVVVYTDGAAFALDTAAGVVADFEGRPVGPNPSFSEGGVSFASHLPLNNLYVMDTTYTNVSPMPTSQVLTGNGVDDIDLSPPAGTHGIGFDTITNDSPAPVVTVYATDGSVLLSHTLAQAQNTAGFIGFFCTEEIGMVRWQTVGGELQNTAIDNVRIMTGAVPAEATSWGQVKSSFR